MRAAANESELYFERGGPAYRLMQRIGLIAGEGPSLGRRIAAIVALTWAPLLVLSLLEGRAIGPTPRESFLLDFASQARLLLGFPLLILAEAIIGPRLTNGGLRFLRLGLVREKDVPAFEGIVGDIARRRDSPWAEAVILAFSLAQAWWQVTDYQAVHSSTWRDVATVGGGVSLAALWFHAVAAPLLVFFFFRWLWRLGLWGLFLFRVSRLDLELVPDHADQACGLGFLVPAQVSQTMIPAILTCVASAEIAFRLLFEGGSIDEYKAVFVVYLVVVEFLVLGPLLVFLPQLAAARRQGIEHYGILLNGYSRAFRDKWITGPPPHDEPVLGSADIQSLSDLGTVFERVQATRPVPFGPRAVIQVALIAALPCLPLALLVVPLSELLDMAASAIM